jgi:uncharacterized protein (TIGR00369 family)
MADVARLRALVEGVTAQTGFTRAIGVRILFADEGHVHMALDRRSDLLQFNGHFHGGVIATLADHAAGAAVTTALPAGQIAVTIDLHVNFLAPAMGETLIAKAKAVQIGSTICVAHVDLTTAIDGAEHACAVALVTLRSVKIAAAPKGGP